MSLDAIASLNRKVRSFFSARPHTFTGVAVSDFCSASPSGTPRPKAYTYDIKGVGVNKKNSPVSNNDLVESNRQSSHKIIWKSFFGGWIFFEFFKNLIVRWLLVGTILLNIANWVLMVIFIRPVDFKIILHYNVYFGVDLIGDWWQPYILPSMGTVFLLVNLAMAQRFYRQKERIAAHILLLASLMIQAGLIIASSAIVMINY